MQRDSESLETLMKRLRTSDHEAYRMLFASQHEPLLRYVCRITRDRALALDVLQDVFLKLWETRTKINVHVSARAMLYTMVRNRALNVNRNRSRMMYNTELVTDDAFEPVENMIEEDFDAMQLNDYFRAWVKELPPRRAEAFILSRYHDLSNREIGEIMGLAKRTVDTHIVHALRYLRGRYEKLQQSGITL